MNKFLFLILLLIANSAFGQTNVVWKYNYGSSVHQTVLNDNEGNIITVAGNVGVKVTKHDQNGIVLWSKPITGGGEFSTWQNRRVFIDDENSIYLTNYLYGINGDNKNYNKTTKITSSGIISWEALYLNDKPGFGSQLNGLVVDSQKNVYVYGWNEAETPGSFSRFLVIKYNSSGIFQWKKVLGQGTGSGQAHCLAIDEQDNIIAGGDLDVNAYTGLRTYGLYKFDTNGNLIWQVEETNVAFYPVQVITDDQSNIVLTGIKKLTPEDNVVRIIKYSSSGNELLFDLDNDQAESDTYGVISPPDLLSDPSGNFYLISQHSTQTNEVNYKTTKFSSSGQILWEDIHTPGANIGGINIPSDAAIDEAGNVSVTGISYKPLPLPNNALIDIKMSTVKYSSTGVKLWETSFVGYKNSSTNAPLGYPPSISTTGEFTYVAAAYSSSNNSTINGGSIAKYADINVVHLFTGCVNGSKDAEVLVPVTANNFKNILSAQFSVSWDVSVVTFVGIEDFALNNEENSFGLTQVNSGMLNFAWFDPALQPQTLSNESTLFNIRFLLSGDYNASTSVAINGQPVEIEVIELNSGDYKPLYASLRNCSVQIDPLVFTGKIFYSNTQGPVKNASVDLSGSDSQMTQTDQDGNYSFYVGTSAPDANYTITPSKTDDPNPMNGIDVQDIAFIRQHILNVQSLGSPYSIIAADVNESHSVTTLDIVYVQALILGTRNEFPNGKQWSFVSGSHTFPNINNPFPYPTTKILTDTESAVSQDFIGIKYGDVNKSRNNSQQGRTKASDVVFETGYPKEELDGTVTIPVRVYAFKNISAYQFNVKWDTDILSFAGRNNNGTEGEFGEHKVEQGLLTTVWDNGSGKSSSLDDGSTLFELSFRKKLDGEKISVRIEPTERLDTRVYDGKLEQLNFVARQQEESPETSEVGIYPNPFNNSVNIRLHVPETRLVKMEITSMTGRVVKILMKECNRGMNELTWDGRDNSGNELSRGIYLVKVKNGSTAQVRKVIKN